VAGYDPDAGLLSRAMEVGAIDEAADSVAAAVSGADAIFCAAPVAALPDLAAQALAASGDDAFVTDVGSVKREVIGRLGEEPRFIGGHPLAGAETAGVENARADLFDGARWYLTPTERTEGMLYDRAQRVVTELGARPQAIDAETHDRLMATVSHLPHVLANVLAARAADSLADESERLPEVGPSFRDATRVAGANPAIWGDILSGNRDAVAAEIDAVVDDLQAASELLRSGNRDAVSEWHGRAGEYRRRLLEAELEGGPLRELRVLVPNQPGIIAELALALGRAGVNIEDMGLHPAADMSSGAVSLFIAGDEEAERAVKLVRDLGHDVTSVER
jgi:prephenate dehydrogenase